MRLPQIIILISLLLSTCTKLLAQTCTITISDTILCEGATSFFTVNTTGGTPSTYSWNFGDGFTTTNAAPGHIYTTAGTYTPTVTVNFQGGASCSVSGNRVRVFANPVSKYTITTEDSMCFKGNNLCILDQSVPGPSNAPIKRRVFQLSNGFLQKDSFPYPNTICYQNTTDVLGHLYTLVLEVTDTNNCISRLQKVDSVRLFQKNPDITFQTNYGETCADVLVNFLNTSGMPTVNVKRFYWDFGDGTKDSVHWNAVAHLYAKPGPYQPRLFVWDNNNCVDTGFSTKAVSSIVMDSNIYALTSLKQCYYKNAFAFGSHNPKGIPTWKVYDKDNNLLSVTVRTVAGNDTLQLSFGTCGNYRINLSVKFADCQFTTDTFVTVLGPKTIIQDVSNITSKIKNTAQCEIFDTIYFKTPVPYLTCMNGNAGKYHIWDFGDAYAPACTTDTRHGLNVGMNCNYSLDSMAVKHKYSPGHESCYLTKLYIKDSLTGCFDYDSISLSLTNPNAHPAPNAVPPRKGLYTIGAKCLPTTITMMLEETLPVCWYEKAWILPDSACGKWLFADSLNRRKYEYNYNSTCSADGYVTIGLVIKNGTDRNGKDCYDTAWYHNILQLLPIDATVKYSYTPSCAPYTAKFTPVDTIQYQLKKIRWNYGYRFYYEEDTTFLVALNDYDPSDTVSQQFSLTDSVLKSQTFQFSEPGVYSVTTSFLNQSDCDRTNAETVAFGFYKNFEASKRISCFKDSIDLIDKVQYYSAKYFDYLNPVTYWRIPSRAAANKEKIWWDIGDGKGFVHTGPTPRIKYDKPGIYTITMVVQDSLGCLDTLIKKNFLHVVDLKPKIGSLQSEYFCAPQIIQFRDSSLVTDSLGSIIPSTQDHVTISSWSFGDGSALSLFTNPAHNFVSNGKFVVTLTATTLSGCSDTAQVEVEVKGPTPSFIIQDSMGCEPFKATFINTSGRKLKSWTWYFGDPANQTFTIATDSSVTFTYLKAGVYDVKILGAEDVFNPTTGNTVTCNSFFPDVLTHLPERRIYVLATPPMDVVSKDTICPNEQLVLKASGDQVYHKLTWVFGDGDTTVTIRPDTIENHIYKVSGVYKFMLIPTNSTGFECADTVRKDIVIGAVQAAFDIDSSTAPQYIFNNASKQGVRYVWDYGKPAAGSSNNGTSTNGTFNYGSDTGTFIICLTAYNKEDCWDSICKSIRIDKTKIIIPNVFTPDNNDNSNDAFDIDILGFTEYDLQIYNRWGKEVYTSTKDGIGNDGINWNGKDHNTGLECSSGTYYFIFKYKLITEQSDKTVHGTITLIR